MEGGEGEEVAASPPTSPPLAGGGLEDDGMERVSEPDAGSDGGGGGEEGAIDEDEGEDTIWVAAARGDVAAVAAFLDAPGGAALLNAVDYEEETPSPPLVLAAYMGQLEVVQLLLARGADVEAKNHGPGWTALLAAAAQNHPDVVALLIRAGADPNVPDNYYRTARMYAAEHNLTQVLAVLNGDLPPPPPPLSSAAASTVAAALSAAAPAPAPAVIAPAPATPASPAVATPAADAALPHPVTPALAALPAADASPAAAPAATTPAPAEPPAPLATGVPIVDAPPAPTLPPPVAVKPSPAPSPAPVAAPPPAPPTPAPPTPAPAPAPPALPALLELLQAIQHGDLGRVKVLVEGNPAALLSTPDVNGNLPLVVAAWSGNADVVHYLLAKGAAVNGGNPKTAFTALHAAAQRGYAPIVKELLRAGASPTTGTLLRWLFCCHCCTVHTTLFTPPSHTPKTQCQRA